MVLESTNVEEFKLIQFNDENNLNAISASDWMRLSEEIQDTDTEIAEEDTEDEEE